MKVWFYSLIICTQLFWAACAQAQTILYDEDFEGTVTGWSVNNTAFDADVSRFLGRFDNSPNSTSRTFTVPTSTDKVEIEFDFYRFDSWDNTSRWGFDRFEIEIDGSEIFSLPFAAHEPARSGTFGTIEWSITPIAPTATGALELAFGTGTYWFDQLHRVEITVNDPGATLELTLRTDINQGGNDESGGFDNMTITAFPLTVLPNLSANKVVETVGMDYALPGNLVEYTLSVENTGGAVDADTLVFVDALPDDIEIFTGDLDGAGNAVEFIDSSSPGSGLTCCGSANIEYSDSTSAPIVFGYIPSTPFDADVTHLRISPSGTLRDSQTNPSNIAFNFRARIK